QLPCTDPTGRLAITADARIDNREELIAALELTGRPSEAIADSRLILAAYERWAERCPERLLGDFDFAIWDGRRPAFVCARHTFAVRPFYYFRSNRLFAFASEIKALLCLSQVPRRLNEVKVADYLAPGPEDETLTFYQEIFRLPPGHSLAVSRDGARLQ